MIAGIIAFLYLKIIQPSLKTMFPPPEPEPEPETAAGVAGAAGHVAVLGEDGEPGEEHVEIDHYAIKVQKARDIAQADPKAVANILKDWMNANG
ncbi:MAG: hypothetical protein L6Q40_06075 [Azonexus sp.]|nr:hypothetical protein [Azonexus sp.]